MSCARLCDDCPRGCRVDRTSDGRGFCGMPEEIFISRAAPHLWEEPPISGTRGSGTVFFTGCNLRCVFCQNRVISHGRRGRRVSEDELCKIIDWAHTHVYSTLYICWGAQAALYHLHGIPKHQMPEKLSGVFRHRPLYANHPLTRGFDETFFMPHSRHTEILQADVEQVESLRVIATSDAAGAAIIASNDGREVFVTGHCEYDRLTLASEYERDLKRGLNPIIPRNYFPNDDPTAVPPMTWCSHAHLLFSNWLNYFVYQQTPYDLELIGTL